jgi:hypothetical protein
MAVLRNESGLFFWPGIEEVKLYSWHLEVEACMRARE